MMNKYFSKLSNILNYFKENWKNPYFYYYHFTMHILGGLYQEPSSDGVDILNQDWDNLIILDACRYDLFETYVDDLNVDGKLSKKNSKGSATIEFLKKNFEGRDCSDIVYVTANPLESRIETNFSHVKRLYIDAWDDKHGTVLPEQVESAGLEMKELNSDKRVIIHFMQPHAPFIGDYEVDTTFRELAMKKGKEEVLKAYKSNFERIMSNASRLSKILSGKTVITSDHGNAYGDETILAFPIYGHPRGVDLDSLVEIPWFEVDD